MKTKSIRERVVSIIVHGGMTFYNGWMFMLAVGVIHHEWVHVLPTIGYAWSVLLAALLRGAFTVVDLDENGKTCRL